MSMVNYIVALAYTARFTLLILHFTLQIYFWGRSRGLTARRRRRDIPNNAAFAIVTGGATQTYTVTNLTPYTDYNMAITAFNSGGEGPASIEVFAPTAEAGKLRHF